MGSLENFGEYVKVAGRRDLEITYFGQPHDRTNHELDQLDTRHPTYVGLYNQLYASGSEATDGGGPALPGVRAGQVLDWIRLIGLPQLIATRRDEILNGSQAMRDQHIHPTEVEIGRAMRPAIPGDVHY